MNGLVETACLLYGMLYRSGLTPFDAFLNVGFLYASIRRAVCTVQGTRQHRWQIVFAIFVEVSVSFGIDCMLDQDSRPSGHTYSCLLVNKFTKSWLKIAVCSCGECLLALERTEPLCAQRME